MEFDEKCPEVVRTELWKQLEATASNELLTAVKKICLHGATLARDINRFFPTFTLHDSVHISNVCAWMSRLLGEKRDELTVQEVALLLMSACCHDIGMSVSLEQEHVLLNGRTDTLEWTNYFKSHKRDELLFLCSKQEGEMDRVGKLTPEILRNYIRANHHRRISEQISHDWPNALRENGITRQTLLDLCRSHGEPLSKLRRSSETRYDLLFCAALLRLSDLLDFDTSRAPDDLFFHLGLDRPETLEERISAAEWSKNRAGVFGPVTDSTLYFTAGFDNLQQEKEVQAYLDYVQSELRECIHQLHRYSIRWKDLLLPYTISTENADRRGYRSGNFRLTMNQDKVIKLLTGNNLYTGADAFVRELLQNAVDAVLYRATIDPRFEVEDGHIVIRSWIDSRGDSWFRIEDNGIGMNEHIIQEYFLKVGESYYDSTEFQLDKLHYGKKTENGQEDYSPISRFGIGFLSCFMSDPDYNQVQVSTRRYSQDSQCPNPGIRLDVTSLNGYYYLGVEGEQLEGDDGFPPMAHPDDTDRGYRTEAGTTICVRANLFRMGGFRSFREIVDKYMCFPLFNVEYIGPEGQIVYKTQQELMDMVHAMNPDGPSQEPKKYVHLISDEMYEAMKVEMPDVSWNEKPSVVLQYYPLDWHSDSRNISGIGVKAAIKADPLIESFRIDGKDYCPEIDIRLTFHSMINSETGFFRKIPELQVHCEFSKEIENAIKNLSPELQLRYQRLSSYMSSDLPEDQLEKWMKEDGYLSNIQRHNFNSYTICSVAYNNILSSSIDEPVLYWKLPMSGFLLLSGSYSPEVGMARSKLDLPLEAECELSVFYHRDNIFHFHGIRSEEEQCWLDILKRHQKWEDNLEIESIDGKHILIKDFKHIFSQDHQAAIKFRQSFNVYGILCIAAIRRYYTVCLDFWGKNNYLMVSSCAPKGSTSSFPCGMFLHPMECSAPFFIKGRYGYNQEHQFSRWLITNQRSLRSLVRGLYNDILKIMIYMFDDTDQFLNGINEVLKQLRNYQNNYFNIQEKLFLTEADIAIIEEDEEGN